MKPSNDLVNPTITLPITLIPYVLAGQRILCSEQLLGRAFEHDLAALRAASPGIDLLKWFRSQPVEAPPFKPRPSASTGLLSC
jgi:hypothetical protein